MNMHCFKCRLIVLVIFSICSGDCCFIIDCPFADKFAGKRDYNTEVPRQCPSCGEGGVGECMASNICCGPGMGCVMGNNEVTKPCQYEARIHQECLSSGIICSLRDPHTKNLLQGVCAMEGLCCTNKDCSENPQCQKMTDEPIMRSRRHLFRAIRNSIEGLRRLARTSSESGTTQYVLPALRKVPPREKNILYRA